MVEHTPALPPINIHVHGQLGEKDRARLFKILEKENRMTVAPVKAAPAKAGVLTSEFWVAVAVAVGSVAAAAQTSLPPRYAEIASAIAAVAYIFSRGQAKR
jgi:hypothetical protein